MADPFNPVDSAALVTKSLPLKKQVQPDALAALPPLLKDRPIILPPKKPKVTLEQGKIDPDAEWFKKHPLQTEHADGTEIGFTTAFKRQTNHSSSKKA